ncbi:MAG: M20/M25/M40 family metallo-hydrolase [Candidatus Heimdallarchaeota archaeon]|nr:M20/M25/M40 family metallo-hydrolase [Candidatus Heimdallarchaeota archaeon]
MSLEKVYELIEKGKDVAIKDLAEFIAIASVSAKEEFLVEAAEFSAKLLKEHGYETKIHETAGGPVVTGLMDVGAKRTLMFYDHADVQPAEPFDLWDSPPFELSIREGRMYGRGTADNKDEIVCRIHAVKAWLDAGLKLPCNIKFVIETEEESSSKNLTDYVDKDLDFFKNVDGCIWEFGGSNREGLQEFILGVKGILYVQLSVKQMNIDSHSASATHLPNAAEKLMHAVNSLKDKEGRILVPEFYDDIEIITNEESEVINNYNFYPEEMKEHYGLEEFRFGMTNEEAKNAYFTKPTCNICGITAGYQGVGGKTVIPKEASVKIDFRLVKNQDPDEILKNLRKYLDDNGFTDVKIDWSNGYPPSKTYVNDDFVKLCQRANKRIYNHEAALQSTSGGSGPMYLFGDHMPVVSLGCGHANTNAHAPNENIYVADFIDGMKMIVTVIDEFKNWK